MISRGVTCDADNQLTSVLQHKHPHELLDSVVKERVVKIFRLNRGAHSTASRVSVKRLFFEAFKVSSATSTTCASSDLPSLVSGRRILQRYNLLSTAFFTAVDSTFEPKHSTLLTSSNYLINKKFSVSSAPEVGRIIDRS